jgi:mono/diheme cytochrome c family protein
LGRFVIRRVFFILVLCLVCARLTQAQPQPPRPELQTGAEVYQAACVACHGADGRGNPQSIVGFSVPLPDFTDCLFATVEAAEGWEAVVHQGGPVRALDRHMPAFGNALSAREIRLVVAHVRTFCSDQRAWPQGDLNFPKALVTEKAFPENENLLTTSFLTGPAHAMSSAIVHERRFGARTMIEFNVPFETQQTPGGSWNYGLGDVAVAVKRDLYHNVARGSIFSLGEEVLLPTGKESQGLGSGVTSFETFAAFGQRLPRESFIQCHGGVGLPTKTEIVPREAFWRTAIGKTFTEGGFYRTWSPMFEVLAARELERGLRTEWDIVPQMQISVSKRRHILVNAGVQIPINEREDRHAQVLGYFLWDFYEGGLLDGWR